MSFRLLAEDVIERRWCLQLNLSGKAQRTHYRINFLVAALDRRVMNVSDEFLVDDAAWAVLLQSINSSSSSSSELQFWLTGLFICLIDALLFFCCYFKICSFVTFKKKRNSRVNINNMIIKIDYISRFPLQFLYFYLCFYSCHSLLELF